MLTGLMLLLLAGAGIVGFIKKHILRIKDPDLAYYLAELKKQCWYQELMNDPQSSRLIQSFEKSGPLKDVYYVQRLLANDGCRDGFIAYIKEKSR
ncbi:hypothetical protein QUF79_13895 [Fictibacillus enclensis]|uniref:hypothetical protein n=1 Tax=Fictibacillus enclensis TaxID=1017270 RepID=UPI0025A1954A|nr:hypothetical protein [Fictibacillus enclensis]MDM5199109.1 hypothetical protein [Fictibacillus enclensis]